MSKTRPSRVEETMSMAEVQRPHQEYMGMKGTPARRAHAESAPMKAKVSPVGARNVIGCPA